jgi:hypothetical protein
MKKCAHCKEFKHLNEFAYSNKILKTRQKHCRACMSKFNIASYQKTDKQRKREAPQTPTMRRVAQMFKGIDILIIRLGRQIIDRRVLNLSP